MVIQVVNIHLSTYLKTLIAVVHRSLEYRRYHTRSLLKANDFQMRCFYQILPILCKYIQYLPCIYYSHSHSTHQSCNPSSRRVGIPRRYPQLGPPQPSVHPRRLPWTHLHLGTHRSRCARYSRRFGYHQLERFPRSIPTRY